MTSHYGRIIDVAGETDVGASLCATKCTTKGNHPAAVAGLLNEMASRHSGETRNEMKKFWDEHSKEATEQIMMLDSNAEVIAKEEIPEILSTIPDITGLDVLELGAGIGRFTGHLAERAASVTAIDFMESFVEKNRELNGHHDNITFLQADVTRLQLIRDSCDVIFSNWLLMYLEESEVRELFTNLLKWLRPGGYFFFRESCYHQSGDVARETNPTKYRDPASYNALLQSVSVPTCDDAGVYAFEIIMSKSIQTYVKMKSNRNQICWLLHKVKRIECENHGYDSFQQFLDQQQYSVRNIRYYETIFGRGFISTGGMETTQEIVKMLNLRADQHVLDVGAGIGGAAFYMAQTYDVLVTGMDLSANIVTMALERANEIKDNRVQFELGDATKREYPKQSFDVVYSRDTILHIRDKLGLFQSFLKWLRPGGKLLVTDYCCSSEPVWSRLFTQYVKQRGYHLVSLQQYEQILKEAGFVNIIVKDNTDYFVDILKKELQRIEETKEEFIRELSEAEYTKMVAGWNDKLAQCASGDHKWALLYAEKQ